MKFSTTTISMDWPTLMNLINTGDLSQVVLPAGSVLYSADYCGRMALWRHLLVRLRLKRFRRWRVTFNFVQPG